jgi:hypothetical protein
VEGGMPSNRKPQPKPRETCLSCTEGTRRLFSKRAARRKTAKQRIDAFIRRQAETKQLQRFAHLAKLYADKSEPYGEREQRAYRELKHLLLTGGFRRQGALCVWAIHERLDERCEVMGEELPALAITDEFLERTRGDPDLDEPDTLSPWLPYLWAPTDLCRQWLEEHGIGSPTDWSHLISPSAPIQAPTETETTAEDVVPKRRRLGAKGHLRRRAKTILEQIRQDEARGSWKTKNWM